MIYTFQTFLHHLVSQVLKHLDCGHPKKKKEKEIDHILVEKKEEDLLLFEIQFFVI